MPQTGTECRLMIAVNGDMDLYWKIKTEVLSHAYIEGEKRFKDRVKRASTRLWTQIVMRLQQYEGQLFLDHDKLKPVADPSSMDCSVSSHN